jgi:chromosome segregation ATPase
MQTIQSPEIEREIGLRERAFDLAKTKVEQLELALQNSEASIERNHHHAITQDRAWRQSKRIEAALKVARTELDEARSKLEEAWGWRAKTPSNTSPTEIQE